MGMIPELPVVGLHGADPKSGVSMEDRPRYLLLKRGLFYRPNAMGYTGIKDHAGRYSLADAESHADPISGVTFVHEAEAPEIAPKCFDDVAVTHLLGKLAAAEMRADILRANLIRADRFIEGVGQDLHSQRAADWFPEGVHDAATSMSESMRLIGNACADFEVIPAPASSDGASSAPTGQLRDSQPQSNGGMS